MQRKTYQQRIQFFSGGKAQGLITVFLLFSFILLTSCDRTRQDKGYEYFPDMAHSLAYETYSDNPVFKNGKTLQPPPEGTIPRGIVPYPYPASPEGRDMAAAELENPVPATPEAIARGKELYTIYCQQCHGVNGEGDGRLRTSGKYSIPPPSLIRDEYKLKPAGDTYHVITQGWGVMGSHKAQIKPEDRWKIVNYIETILQGK